MFRPNCPSAVVQVAEEIALPFSSCYILYFKGTKYLQNKLKLFLKYRAIIILLYARLVVLVCILLVCWFLFGATHSEW
jgi:hypothetical protein